MVPAMVVASVARLATVAPPDDPLGPSGQDPEAVRDTACKLVSARPGTCSPSTPRPPNRRWNLDLSVLSLLLWIILVAGVVALLYLLVRALLRRTGKAPKRRRRSGDDSDSDVLETDAVAVDRSREPTNWRAEAERHRAAGRYRDSLRCRYRALVGDLARRGLIDEIPGRTTGEERAQLRRVVPSASSPFDSAADLFDGAWYGHADVAVDDDDRFQLLERDVLAVSAGDRR